MLITLGLLSIVLLTVATGYFVAQEFTYVAVDRNRLTQLAEQGDRRAGRALRVTGQLSFMLSGAQLGITMTALLVGYVAEPLLGSGLAGLLGVAGVPVALSLSIGVVLALVFATTVQMVLGELAPKNLGIATPERVARALAGSTLVYLKVFGPVIRLFDAASNRLLRALGIEPVEELPSGATPEDLEQIVRDSHEVGQLDAELSRLLDRGLDFRTLTAEQAMTPRVDVRTVHGDEPAGQLVELLGSGHTRFPVVGETVDDLLGVVGVHELAGVPVTERSGTPVRRIATPAVLVPGTLPLPAVLERLRAEHRQLACVVDEFGGFAGVVSLEDLAEELVGEILDEDDAVAAGVLHRPDGSWVVPGRWRVDEIADATGIALPEGEDYETVSGLVLDRLGRTAEVGDRVTVELPAHDPSDEDEAARLAAIEVTAVHRRVPRTVSITDSEATP